MPNPVIESTEVEVEQPRKATLLPEFLVEALATVTITCRTARRTAEAVERTVIGIDLVATTMLRQQQERLLAELSED